MDVKLAASYRSSESSSFNSPTDAASSLVPPASISIRIAAVAALESLAATASNAAVAAVLVGAGTDSDASHWRAPAALVTASAGAIETGGIMPAMSRAEMKHASATSRSPPSDARAA